MLLNSLLAKIQPLNIQAMKTAETHQSQLTKPKNSLGRLEEISIQMAGIMDTARPQVHNKVIIVMAADHGVVQEGVSAYPQSVTAQMVSNIVNGGAAISVLSRHLNARLVVADMGVAVDLLPHPNLTVKKTAYGTNNISRGPAMSRTQAEACLLNGAQVSLSQIQIGMDILAIGEMGIGNTTSSTAIAAAISGEPPESLAGPGTGIDQNGMQRKLNVINRALQINKVNPNDGLDVLTKLGGFEIGGMAGAILAAASNRRAVVIDGFISTAAAMIACLLAPDVRQYIIAGHISKEGGHTRMLDWLGIRPLLNLDLCLGEGTGAVLAFPIIELACDILNEMATFDQAGVSKKGAL